MDDFLAKPFSINNLNIINKRLDSLAIESMDKNNPVSKNAEPINGKTFFLIDNIVFAQI